jgi:hypothetical protein
MEEKLIAKRRKEIVQDIINILSKEDPNLYYTPTNEIGMEVVKYIKENKLNAKDYELVKDLTFQDVQIYMSYNSNCC